jgi:HAD superfamily hydrolase (TIGR01509 family)
MPHVWTDVLTTLQVDETTWRPAWRKLGPLLGAGKIEESDFWQQIVTRTGARGPLPEESLFLRQYGKRWTVHQPVLDLVAQLKAAGLRTAILSNTIAAHVGHNRDRGLYAPFDVHVFSNEVGVSKPDPAIFRHTLDLLDLSGRPEAAFFVDDMEENVDAASALGLHGILFTSPEQLVEDVRRLGVAF